MQLDDLGLRQESRSPRGTNKLMLKNHLVGVRTDLAVGLQCLGAMRKQISITTPRGKEVREHPE
ncbi:MAG: hypothetical protein CV090_03955 [Nitrospira sp. WS238]|mgnify:CR=1 FL=1|nr:hypothetical protein [Nitrospira sp. WS238]